MLNHLIFKRAVSQLLFCLCFLLSTQTFAVGNSIVAVDKDGTTGQYTSLVLDAQGNPTISYYDATEGKLKVVHCLDKNCALFNAIVTPDSSMNVGLHTSTTLDSLGNPIVSYYDQINSALKILHCGNTSCTQGNSIATVDTNGTVGQYNSITLDGLGNPVVSYYNATQGKLKVLHCGNANCTAGNTIVTPDLNSSNGVQSSIKINSLGNPVIAYFDFTNSALKILRCGNAICTIGNVMTTPDAAGDVGRYPSLVLNSSGNPVVSYLDLTNGKLKLLRCGNATCSAGNTITSIQTPGIAGYFSSLQLDSLGNPVVSFYNQTNGDLNILHCGNNSCSNDNVITIPDATGQVGLYSSLRLDGNGFPVVSYYDATNGDLKLLHCGSTTCSPNSIVVADSAPDVGRYSAIKLDSSGNPVVSYWDSTNGNLKVLHCANANCTGVNSIASPDTTGNTGWDTSLALDVAGKPVISLYDFTAKQMKVVHCANTNCTGAANSLVKPDILSQRHTSVALDSSGNPVVASSGQQDQGLRIVHCGDANCAANNSITSPDSPAFPFQADVRGVSLTLDVAGNPVVSFYRADKGQFKVLHCADPACSGPGNSLVVLDPGAQVGDHRSTSITLDAAGNPAIAYQDTANNALKILRCGNANCSAGNIITPVVNAPNAGFQPSIKLDAGGKPVVSFNTDLGFSVLHCGNANCTTGNTLTIIDTGGWDSALALDATGNPVVSYYHPTLKNLKVAHCGTPTCQ